MQECSENIAKGTDKCFDPESDLPVYTLREASEISGVPLHSVRQYIDKGLIIPFKKKTQRHLFSGVDIQRLKCIRRLLHERGLNIAGIKSLYAMIPCWYVKDCPPWQRKTCEAYDSLSMPCWESSHKGRACLNDECRTCEVYKIMEKCDGLKNYLHQQLV